jgi:hypothetical protein
MQQQISSVSPAYRLGLIDPARLAQWVVDPFEAPCFTLLVPAQEQAVAALLVHPDFQEAAIDGYLLASDPGDTPARIVNWVWNELDGALLEEANARPWFAGWLLGVLARVAETDRVLALVGIAHLVFLLSFLPDGSPDDLYMHLSRAHFQHGQAVRAYRAEVRELKAQGADFFHASRAALAGRHDARVYALNARCLAEKVEVA